MTDMQSPEVKRAKTYMQKGKWTALSAEDTGNPDIAILRSAAKAELERVYEEHGGGHDRDYVERHMKDLVYIPVTILAGDERKYTEAFNEAFEQALDAMMDEREKPSVKQVLEDKNLSVNNNAFGVFQVHTLPPRETGDEEGPRTTTLGMVMCGDVQAVLAAALTQQESRKR